MSADDIRYIKEHALHLYNSHQERNRIFAKMEDIYWMRWEEEPAVTRQVQNVKITKSPRGRNAIHGILRLLCASDPTWSVPMDINTPAAQARSEKIEKFAKAMWWAAGTIYGQPLHYEIIRQAALFAEIHIALQNTKDLVTFSKGGPGEKRAEEIAERTPFLFVPTNPSLGYPEWDALGLSSFYSRRQVTRRLIRDTFGKMGEKALSGDVHQAGKSSYDLVWLNDFYTLDCRYVWLDESQTPILEEEHGLPFIPIVAATVEGSRLFDKPEEQREPVLYTLYKSGLLSRQNLILTVLYTMLFAVGANPMFVEYLVNPEQAPDVDYSEPGGTIRYRVGERREPMAKQIIDPAMLEAWRISLQLEEESTIHRQSLGEPLGANAPYSMVALLSQAGRLPLVVLQRMASFAMGEAVVRALKWHKKEGGKAVVNARGINLILTPKEIPEHIELQANLDIALPQDRLQSANAANLITMGDRPLASKRWARENLLGIGQSDTMQEEIWTEQVADLWQRKYVLGEMAQIAQMEQAAIQPPTNASGIPGTPAQNVSSPPFPGAAMGSPPSPSPSPFPPGAEPIQSPFEPMTPLSPPPPVEQGGGQ